MKILIIVLILISSACGQNPKENVINLDKYAGIYEYVYPYNTHDLNENHFIVLTINNDKMTGLYYGTSDEFDETREGYLPGFFVSPMDNLQMSGDSVSFVLNTNNSDFLTESIDLKIQSTKEAINTGYKNWGNSIFTIPKTYYGIIKDPEMIIVNQENEIVRKTFKKKK